MRIVLADDHPIFTSSLEMLLTTISNVEVVGTVHDGASLLPLLSQKAADVVICDIQMPGMDGLAATRLIKSEFPGVRVLILSMNDDVKVIREGIAAGISGFLSKKTKRPELETALQMLAAGQTYFGEEHLKQLALYSPAQPEHDTDLSKREIEVIRLVVDELSNQEIAKKLYISINTVESHRKNIYRKIGVTNTGGLMKYALRHGLIPSV